MNLANERVVGRSAPVNKDLGRLISRLDRRTSRAMIGQPCRQLLRRKWLEAVLL